MQHSSCWVTRLCVSVNYLVTSELYNNNTLFATQYVGVRCMDMSSSNGTEVWCYGMQCIYWGMQAGRNLWFVSDTTAACYVLVHWIFRILVPLVDTDAHNQTWPLGHDRLFRPASIARGRGLCSRAWIAGPCPSVHVWSYFRHTTQRNPVDLCTHNVHSTTWECHLCLHNTLFNWYGSMTFLCSLGYVWPAKANSAR